MKQRVILITGATRGLGRALAAEFARAGHTVAGCGRSREHIAALEQSFGPPHSFAPVDVSSDSEVAEWARTLKHGKLIPDLLLNNAAVITPERPLWEVPAEDFSRIVDINIKGVVNMLRHFAPLMIERGRGTIVNFSSGWGRGADAGFGPYIATKWAIEGMTRALALDLPPGLAAVSLSPGIIDTDMLRIAFGDAAADHPSPQDWAKRAAPFLLKIGPKENGQPLTIE